MLVDGESEVIYIGVRRWEGEPMNSYDLPVQTRPTTSRSTLKTDCVRTHGDTLLRGQVMPLRIPFTSAEFDHFSENEVVRSLWLGSKLAALLNRNFKRPTPWK